MYSCYAYKFRTAVVRGATFGTSTVSRVSRPYGKIGIILRSRIAQQRRQAARRVHMSHEHTT